MKTPCFDGYIAIDIPNPLNDRIYSIRESFSDKKMCAMPVDIPIIGVWDENRTIVRNEVAFCELLDTVKNDLFSQADQAPFELITDKFLVNELGQLLLIFKPNTIYQDLLETCRAHLLKAGITVDVVSGIHPVMYVVLKSHLPAVEMDKWHKKEIRMQVPVSSISLYHKEAVPLTRLYSVSLNL